MNVNLRLLIWVAGLSFCFTGNVLADSCSAITGDEPGSPTGDRIRKANAAVFSELGLTKVLTRFNDPGKCWDLPELNKNFELREFKKTDLCLRFEDYGVGSFDPLKHNYCQHNLYVLQLHDESPAVRRVFKIVGGRGAYRIDVIGEFDEKGNKVSGSSGAMDTASDEQKTGQPTAESPSAPAAPPARQQLACYKYPGLDYEFIKVLPQDVCARPRPGQPHSSVLGFACDEEGNPWQVRDRGRDASMCRDFPSKMTGGEWRVINTLGPWVQLNPNLPTQQRDEKQGKFNILYKVGTGWEPWAKANNDGRVVWLSPQAEKQYAASGGTYLHAGAPGQPDQSNASTPPIPVTNSVKDAVKKGVGDFLERLGK